jgi:hypothetical protein
MSEKIGSSFLHAKDKGLHKSKDVAHQHRQQKIARVAEKERGEKPRKISEQPAEKIENFLSVLERTHAGKRRDPRVLKRIKKYYHKHHVINHDRLFENENYWDFQREIILKEGKSGDFQKNAKGEIDIPDYFKEERIENIQADQKGSLDVWVDYFIHPDADVYPTWAKYWAFTGMTKLGKYDKSKKIFQKRTKDTVAPFPDLNREALAYAIDMIVKKNSENAQRLSDRIAQVKKILNRIDKNSRIQQRLDAGVDDKGKMLTDVQVNRLKKSIKDYPHEPAYYHDQLTALMEQQDEIFSLSSKDSFRDDFYVALNTENFGMLYAYAMDRVASIREFELQTVSGEWVMYPKGSDHMPLVESLQGYGTGWCTAAESTAESQLEDGDFYIYYSYDNGGQSNVPRIAIRMEGDEIAEVRGVAEEQNLDEFIASTDILHDKLDSFGFRAEEYQKKSGDMKQLTLIYEKYRSKQEMSNADLRFLYEIDGYIEGFGYSDDPRIEEIKEKRDPIQDYCQIFDCEEHQIARTVVDLHRNNQVVYFGEPLDIGTSEVDFTFPKYWVGDLTIQVEGGDTLPKLPETLLGDLSVSGDTSLSNPSFPSFLRGGIEVKIHDASNEFDLNLNLPAGLESLDLYCARAGIINVIKGPSRYIKFEGLVSARSIVLSEMANIELTKLENVDELVLSESPEISVFLDSLTNFGSIVFPTVVREGYMNLGSLKSLKGLKLPRVYNGDINLKSLESLEGAVLPEDFKGLIYVESQSVLKELRTIYPEAEIVDEWFDHYSD